MRMEQLINTMLANAQMSQAAPAAQKSGSAPADGFQKLLEQKVDPQAGTTPEKADAAQKPQDSAQNSEKPQEAQQQAQEPQRPAAPKEGKELEEQMMLAAMAMLQNPVVPVEEMQVEMMPEVQVEMAVDAVAPLMAETVLAPEQQSIAPETETTALEIPVEEAAATAAGQQQAVGELPQTTIEAPEAPQKTEERTVEVKVEVSEAAPQAVEDSETEEETPQLQDAEAAAPVFEDVKAVPVKVGEAPRTAKEQPVEEQIAPKVTEALQNGETRVELQLEPENLGKVTVEMTWSEDHGLVVQIHAENRETQNLLSRNTVNLAELLGREVKQEVRVEVPRQEESQRQDLYEQQQERQQRHRQQEQRRKQTASGEDFLQQLRLGLIPLDGE